MPYQVLARHYRPNNFQQIVGQTHIVQALRNALAQQQLHHAYLFTGTRGVGKTTLARIMAKCLNCESGITAEPCGICSHCVEINNGCFPDLLEIDAASHTKVESTREILENVPYKPVKGRFKIYIIDEVHMLSNHSFNALLKTLEEPPPHVKFILATTDPQKLPATVVSRCLQFHLYHLAPELITQQLTHILTQENYSFEKPALQAIANAASGSMRDALSLLDQCIAYGDKKICEDDVNKLLGLVNSDVIHQLLQAVQQCDANLLTTTTYSLAEQGLDFKHLLDQLIVCLHELQCLQLQKESNTSQALNTFVNAFTTQQIQQFYQLAIQAQQQLAYTPTPRIALEMALLNMIIIQQTPVQPSKPTPQPASAQPINTTAETQPISAAKSTDNTIHKVKNLDKPSAPANSTVATSSTIDWADTVNKLPLSGMSAQLAQHCVLKSHNENQLILLLDPKQKALLLPNFVTLLEQALSKHLKQQTKVKITLADPTDTLLTPAKQNKIQHQKRTDKTKQTISENPVVKSFIQETNATISDESIRYRDE